jgi:hypothetical protein
MRPSKKLDADSMPKHNAIRISGLNASSDGKHAIITSMRSQKAPLGKPVAFVLGEVNISWSWSGVFTV